MDTVYTRNEMIKVLKSGKPVLLKGKYAQEFRDEYEAKRRRKKLGVAAAVALAAGGLAAAPFTGGTSLAGTAAGVAALTIGSVTLSTAELAIICGTALAALGILRGAKVTFKKDGSVVIEPK